MDVFTLLFRHSEGRKPSKGLKKRKIADVRWKKCRQWRELRNFIAVNTEIGQIFD